LHLLRSVTSCSSPRDDSKIVADGLGSKSGASKV